MSDRCPESLNRRDLLSGLTLAATAGLLGSDHGLAEAEPPPETTGLRLLDSTWWVACDSPAFVALELLRAEGFTIEWVGQQAYPTTRNAFTGGGIDFHWGFSGRYVTWIDAGVPITVLSGVHVGCFDLFGSDRVRAIRDLKGKTVSVESLGSGRHIFLATLLANVGLDPRTDVNFVEHLPEESARLFADGKVDAYIGFGEESHEMRARKVGHIVLNTATDRPWSHYFCCMLTGHSNFVRTHPVATKRVLRAWLKAADICAREPARAARLMVDTGRTKNYDTTVQTVKALPFDVWRRYDPEDTVRFYALRLREAGMIKSGPQKIIAQGTDWRSLNELKKELKT
jgi:NitT/TauT family transport system substrate-binding protein